MLRYYRGNYLVSATTRALEDAVAAWCPETLTERNGKGAAGKRGGGGGGGGGGGCGGGGGKLRIHGECLHWKPDPDRGPIAGRRHKSANAA